MTANEECTAFDTMQLVYANEGMYRMVGESTESELICTIHRNLNALTGNDPEHVDHLEPHMSAKKMLQIQSLDTIRINTNRNPNGNIRSFLNNTKLSQDRICDWDPMKSLAGMLSDYPTDKDVLETLDELRDSFRE